MKRVTILRCSKAGMGYAEGELYPVVGYTGAGAIVARAGENEKTEAYEFMHKGCGIYDNPDGSRAPIFETYTAVTI